jgi:hypothetical protein
MASIMRRHSGLIAWSVMGWLLSLEGGLQLLIFRQDAPVISPHSELLAAEPYRASGLVLLELKPTTLALMHGSAFRGDAVGAISALADRFEARLQAAMVR